MTISIFWTWGRGRFKAVWSFLDASIIVSTCLFSLLFIRKQIIQTLIELVESLSAKMTSLSIFSAFLSSQF